MGKLISVFFLSMAPVVELRGAIPAGVASGLSIWIAAPVAIIGNMVPVPFVLVFIRKIFRWMESKNEHLGEISMKIQARAMKNRDKILKYEFWGLVAVVAVPLPGTGAWTGAILAALVDMQLKRAVPAILIGVVIAGIIVSLATVGVVAMI